MATSTLLAPVVEKDERVLLHFWGFVKKGGMKILPVLEAHTAVAVAAAVTAKGADGRVVFVEMNQ